MRHHIAPNGVAFLAQLAQHSAEIDGVLENERVGDLIAIVQPLFLLNRMVGIDDPLVPKEDAGRKGIEGLDQRCGALDLLAQLEIGDFTHQIVMA